MLRLPQPTAAWPLDGTSAAAYGGAAATLHGACAQPWTEGPTNGSKALRVARSCYASVDNAPSLALGAGSLSACVRLRTSTLGATLLAKLRVGAAGFAVEVAEGGRGLGVALADTLGTSVYEEVGRVALADGRWHHACVVLQRWGAAQLSVYIDGRPSDSLRLDGSRLARLGSVDSEAPLLLGRRTPPVGEDATGARSAAEVVALCDVAIWSRALLPEHVAALAQNGLPPPRRRRAPMVRPGLSAVADDSSAPRMLVPRFSSVGAWTAPSALLVLAVVAAGAGVCWSAPLKRRCRTFIASTRSTEV